MRNKIKTSTITTTDDEKRIYLPITPHIDGKPWTFDTSVSDTSILLFYAKEPRFGMEYRIWLNDGESHPWANLSCGPLDRKYHNNADSIRDDASGAAGELREWLKDCADAYAWTCRAAVRGWLGGVIEQQVMERELNQIRPVVEALNYRLHYTLEASGRTICSVFGVMDGDSKPSAFIAVTEPRTVQGIQFEHSVLETHDEARVLDFLGVKE